MNPLLRLLGAAASHGLLLTGQIVFSAAFVGACELPNWIQAAGSDNGPQPMPQRRRSSTEPLDGHPAGLASASIILG
jgi:hypothetical protein